MNAAPKN